MERSRTTARRSKRTRTGRGWSRAYDAASPDMRRIILASAFVFALVAARQRAVLHPPAPQVTDGPTFNKEVVRIFQNRCQSCHHPGDIAPFSLMTYADARPYASEIKLMTGTHQMPPWKPVSGCSNFTQARVMPQSEIDLLAKFEQPEAG